MKEQSKEAELVGRSPYGKFHWTYLGYDFKEIKTGKLYTKGDFWDRFNSLAVNLILDLEHPKVPMGFSLAKRPEPEPETTN